MSTFAGATGRSVFRSGATRAVASRAKREPPSLACQARARTDRGRARLVRSENRSEALPRVDRESPHHPFAVAGAEIMLITPPPSGRDSTRRSAILSCVHRFRSMEGGSVDELLDVTVERPV